MFCRLWVRLECIKLTILGFLQNHINKFEGTWQRRGHSSHQGIVTAISTDTGKCVDFDVLLNICTGCRYWDKQDTTSVRYFAWKLKHNYKPNMMAPCNWQSDREESGMGMQSGSGVFTFWCEWHENTWTSASVLKGGPQEIQKVNSRRKMKSAILTATSQKNRAQAEEKIVKKTGPKGKLLQKRSDAASKEKVDIDCMVCGDSFRNSASREEWVKCISCQKWVHYEYTDALKSYECAQCRDSNWISCWTTFIVSIIKYSAC